jgi:hypothetical protein
VAGRNLFADVPAASAKQGKNLFADQPPAAAPAPVEEDYGPLGLGDNFARAGQTLDDSMRLLVDTGSRGYIDKWLGPEEQAKTAAARERQGWGGTAVDVGAAVLTSPYKVRSMAAGAGYGGLEGAASSYAHSDSWVPNPLEIGKDALIGAATGGFGAKAGEWFGGAKATKDAKANQPYPTDDSLRIAADEAQFTDPHSPQTADLGDRVSRLDDVRSAKGRDEFANLRAGNPEEAALFKQIAEKKGPSAFAADQIERLSLTKGVDLKDVPRLLRQGVDLKTTGGVGMLGATAADLLGVPAKLRGASGREAERAAALVRDPRGIGLAPDQTTINAWRDRLSKAAAGYGREP